MIVPLLFHRGCGLSTQGFLLNIHPESSLLGLDKANSTSISLVHNADFVGLFITEDVKVVVNVVKCEDSFFDRDGFAQVETTISESCRGNNTS